jgi:ATP diphosphatase
VDVAEVKRSWEAIKRDERAARAQGGVLDDVPVALPALPRAQKLQKRAALVGFDWPDAAAVLEKLDEEHRELRDAMAAGSATAIADEMGDLLFTCVNLARHLGLDAEAVLRQASGKFERRFRSMEKSASGAGSADLRALNANELDALWRAAKALT